MRSCLENCKPGDILHTKTRKYIVASYPIDGVFTVNYYDGIYAGAYAGCFTNLSIAVKIVKAKR